MPAALAQRDTRYAPGKIIVRFDPRGDVVPRTMVDIVEVLTRGRASFFDDEFVPGFAAIRVEAGTEQEAVERVQGLPGLMYATRSAIAELASQPNDPWFPQQWQFQNTGQVVNQHSGEVGIANCDMCAVTGWGIRSDASPVIVAVLDSGLNYLLPDIKDNLWVNPLDPPGNGDDDNNGFVDDTYGIRLNDCDANYDTGDPYEASLGGGYSSTYGGAHGTAVAGFVGARGNNQFEGTGTAHIVRIMTLAGFDYNGIQCGFIDDAAITLGFKYAWQHGAKIINCSFGSSTSTPAMYDAFYQLDLHGLLAVVCAHNYDVDIDNPSTPPTTGFYPPRYGFKNMIVVGASDECNRRAIWCPHPPPSPCPPGNASNWGAKSVDLFAPGRQLRTFDGNEEGNTYMIASAPNYCGGTSFATPLVSGGTALVWALHPTWSSHDVATHVISNASPVNCLQGLCTSGGIFNLARALGGNCPHSSPCCAIPTGPCCQP